MVEFSIIKSEALDSVPNLVKDYLSDGLYFSFTDDEMKMFVPKADGLHHSQIVYHNLFLDGLAFDSDTFMSGYKPCGAETIFIDKLDSPYVYELEDLPDFHCSCFKNPGFDVPRFDHLSPEIMGYYRFIIVKINGSQMVAVCIREDYSIYMWPNCGESLWPATIIPTQCLRPKFLTHALGTPHKIKLEAIDLN